MNEGCPNRLGRETCISTSWSVAGYLPNRHNHNFCPENRAIRPCFWTLYFIFVGFYSLFKVRNLG